MNFLLSRLSSLYRSSIEEFENEAKRRARDQILSRFSKVRHVTLVATIVLLALVLIYELVTPPLSITSTLSARPDQYMLFREGRLSFDTSISPSERLTASAYKISLPFRIAHQLPDYDPKNILYEFEISIPSDHFEEGKHGLLIPMIWGKASLFVNGELYDFGTNLWPVFGLNSPKNIILIRVDVSQTTFRNPISATYPLVVGDINELRSLAKTVEEQSQIRPRATALFALALVIFGVLFIAYPKKPELLAFILFLVASITSSFLGGINEKNFRFFENWHFQQILFLAVDLLVNVALLTFSMFFLRAHPTSVAKAISTSLIAAATIGCAIAFFLYQHTSSGSYRLFGHVALNIVFMCVQVVFFLPRIWHLGQSRMAPKARIVTSSLAALSIIILYCLNIFDFFFSQESITTQYRNGLLLNFFLSLVVAYEVSRAELNQLVFGSMLPREVKETIHLSNKSKIQRGFVVLVDAIGFSSDRSRFENPVERSLFIERLALRMLRPLAEKKGIDFSLLNCTGDGIYCAIRGEATKENYFLALELARSIVKLTPEKGDQIEFRAAIGFGEYVVQIVEAGQIRKEFVAGNVLNDLSRVIGGKSSASPIRVLICDQIKEIVTVDKVKSVVDKHGCAHMYFEESETNKKAA